MNIAIGADHRGFSMKAYLKQYVVGVHDPIAWIDVGAFDDERSDYPVFAEAVSRAILNNEAQKGVLICGSGVGMGITANRFPSIYAGVAWNEDIARHGRENDNVNVLVIPSDYVSDEQAAAIVTAWLSVEFKGGRYQERIDMINNMKVPL